MRILNHIRKSLSLFLLAMLCALPLWVQAQTQIGDNIFGAEGQRSFGRSVSLTADGQRLAISEPESGYVQVYDWTGAAWTQVGNDIDNSANSVALSSNGRRLAVGKWIYRGLCSGSCDPAHRAPR